MDGGREGTEGGGGGEDVWLSVEPLDSKSWILGVPDFNLEEEQREKETASGRLQRAVEKKWTFGEKRACSGEREKGWDSFIHRLCASTLNCTVSSAQHREFYNHLKLWLYEAEGTNVTNAYLIYNADFKGSKVKLNP